jgi:hypothetical protein
MYLNIKSHFEIIIQKVCEKEGKGGEDFVK